jgi:hypothetical protein
MQNQRKKKAQIDQRRRAGVVTALRCTHLDLRRRRQHELRLVGDGLVVLADDNSFEFLCTGLILTTYDNPHSESKSLPQGGLFAKWNQVPRHLYKLP